MAGVTYGKRGSRILVKKEKVNATSSKSAEDIVREIKASQKASEEDYRERSLAIHGLICARCGREFDASNRHLLTVHHKDGNHHNNPPDGSNWENLCIYCHEDVHSREILGDYFNGDSPADEHAVFYSDPEVEKQTGVLAAKLKEALEKKKR
jgi:DNA-directed RNA polymerase subunit RPC12/RpoP